MVQLRSRTRDSSTKARASKADPIMPSHCVDNHGLQFIGFRTQWPGNVEIGRGSKQNLHGEVDVVPGQLKSLLSSLVVENFVELDSCFVGRKRRLHRRGVVEISILKISQSDAATGVVGRMSRCD